jgi:glycosyltransferase involved in cell wall biosynthesis
VSVIVPALNAQDHVAEMLAGLARQEYAGDWELVIADNGCTDRTVEIAESWRDRLPGLRVVDARDRRGVAHARNVATAAAHGEFLACLDTDDVPATGWLRGLTEAAAEADLVRAESERVLLNEGLAEDWPPVWPPMSPGGPGFRNIGGHRLGVWTDIAAELRWDESLDRGGEDVDFSCRARLREMTFAKAPNALIHKRLRRRLPEVARQAFWYGYCVPIIRARHGSEGMRLAGLTRRQRSARVLNGVRAATRSRAARATLVWDLSFAAGRVAGGPAARRERRRLGSAGEAREPAGASD